MVSAGQRRSVGARIPAQCRNFGVGFISTFIDIGEPVELPIACCAPVGASDLTEAEAVATATLFKALADPHRVRILNRLVTAGEAVCVCELNEGLGVSQPTVSFHLKKLLDAGIVEREQRGTWAYYSINDSAVGTLTDVLKMEVSA
jgi:ArsR family transcriptional regulator